MFKRIIWIAAGFGAGLSSSLWMKRMVKKRATDSNNGNSVIHKKFSMLGIQDEEAEQKFGFLLDAFKYGAPPHAGFAFGIDRLVALLAGEENIREVIAFPKTQSGSDPLTNAPTPLDPTHLEELGLRLAPETT